MPRYNGCSVTATAAVMDEPGNIFHERYTSTWDICRSPRGLSASPASVSVSGAVARPQYLHLSTALPRWPSFSSRALDTAARLSCPAWTGTRSKVRHLEQDQAAVYRAYCQIGSRNHTENLVNDTTFYVMTLVRTHDRILLVHRKSRLYPVTITTDG